MIKDAHTPNPSEPFSRPFLVDELLRRPEESLTIEATEEERDALARADGIPAIHMLRAEFRISRVGKFIHVNGEVRARVTQICVVSLDPFESELVEPVEVRFAPQAHTPVVPPAIEGMSRRRASQANARQEAARKEKAPPPVATLEGEEDPPDPIIDGRIDLGALAAEFLALGLDPYPRKPGVVFEPIESEPEEESPFAALARLRKPE